MNSNVTSRIVIDEHLAKGIPALSPATGLTELSYEEEKNINLNNESNDFLPNDWWRLQGNLRQRWLHSERRWVSSQLSWEHL